jgi:hypothetical protein
MARIGWFDAHARRNVGDQATFDNIILAPIQRDLIAYTWLHERYGCDGLQQMNRTEAYFEYPATVAMLLREIRYGVNMGFTNVRVAAHSLTPHSLTPTSLTRSLTHSLTLTHSHSSHTQITINPFGPSAFSYHVGNVHVDYSSTQVTLSFPGTSNRAIAIYSLAPAAQYKVTGVGCVGLAPFTARTDASGTLQLNVPVGTGCFITATKA